MILSIDLGGSKLELAAISDGVILYQQNLGTEADFIAQLEWAITSQLKNNPEIRAIALGVPGPTHNGVMQGSKPLNCLDDIDFVSIFSDKATPIIVKNDLHMAAYSELYLGVGQEHDNFCLISLSTGIGTAAVINKRILEVRTEMGHQVLYPDFEPRQECTNHCNCWVSLASGNAIKKRFAFKVDQSTEDVFNTLLTESHLEDLQNINAHAIGNIINAYDPEVICVMGSLGLNQFEKIIPSSEQLARFTISRPIPEIIKSSCGKSAGIMGAYYAAIEYLNAQEF